MSDVLTFGESMLVLRAARPGHLRAGDAFHAGVAGAESTVAIGLSRLGYDVEWVGPVGDDEAGRLVRSTVLAEGVHASGRVEPGRPTGVLLRTERRPARVVVDYHRRGTAASTLTPADLDAALTRTTRAVHTTGITAALGEEPAAAVRHTLRSARARGLLTSFDVNHRSKLTGVDAAAAVLRDVLPALDVLFVGDDELVVLAAALGRSGIDVDRALDLDVVPELVVKCGDRGAAVRVDGTRYEAPAVTVDLVDTVGAGDCFAAGYLAARLDGADPAGRLALGASLGAACVADLGDWENLPTRRELETVASCTTAR